MTRPEPKGWCPGAHRPMLSGDGLLVRVRPRLARLTSDQMRGLAEAARRWGSGLIEVTNRANLQLRGVKPAFAEPLLKGLAALDLLDVEASTEARRNILTAPDWQTGDATERLAVGLAARLGDLPPLPAKFGFAIDAGPSAVLQDAPADIRIERGQSGGLILRADGHGFGTPILETDAVDRLLALARWFAQHAGPDLRRMAQMADKALRWPEWYRPTEAPLRSLELMRPGLTATGACIGLPFGQIPVDVLLDLPATAVRITPWRLLILEGLRRMPDLPGLLTRADDHLLAVDACPGAPFCAAATVRTRSLARALVPLLAAGQSLHVSGCAKGCARARPADLTLVGRDGRFDIVQTGAAWDTPRQSGLRPGDLAGAIHALQL